MRSIPNCEASTASTTAVPRAHAPNSTHATMCIRNTFTDRRGATLHAYWPSTSFMAPRTGLASRTECRWGPASNPGVRGAPACGASCPISSANPRGALPPRPCEPSSSAACARPTPATAGHNASRRPITHKALHKRWRTQVCRQRCDENPSTEISVRHWAKTVSVVSWRALETKPRRSGPILLRPSCCVDGRTHHIRQRPAHVSAARAPGVLGRGRLSDGPRRRDARRNLNSILSDRSRSHPSQSRLSSKLPFRDPPQTIFCPLREPIARLCHFHHSQLHPWIVEGICEHARVQGMSSPACGISKSVCHLVPQRCSTLPEAPGWSGICKQP